MKKLVLFALVLLATVTAQAQTAKDALKKAEKAVNACKSEPNPAKIKEAATALDEALKMPENAAISSAWLMKANFYNGFGDYESGQQQIASIKKEKFTYQFMTSVNDAFSAGQQALKTAVKKGEIKDAIEAITKTEGYINRYGSQYYENKEKDPTAITKAYDLFKLGLDVSKLLKDNKKPSLLDDPKMYNNQLYLIAATSIEAKKEKESMFIYQEMIKAKTDTFPWVYSGMFAAQLDDKGTPTPEAIASLEMGRKKFPTDNSLLFSEINYYLKANKLEQLIDKLKQGIAQEPKNVSLVFTLGNVYDNLSQRETDATKKGELEKQAMTYYDKTLEMDSKNVDAIYSIGANFFNKAAALTKELVGLSSDMSREGDRKYKAKEAEVNQAFDRALPYFQRAESINPNDRNTLIALKEIFSRKGELDKSAEFKKRLAKLEEGGKNDASYFKN